MLRLFFVVSFLTLQSVTNAQVIKGKIVDVNTEEGIPYANVYIDGSSSGAVSNLYGNFEYDMAEMQSKTITISAIGYYSQTINLFTKNQNLYIELLPKVYDIHEAVVTSQSLVKLRRKNLRIFKQQLFGFTDKVDYCEILNEDDITFNYFENPDTLKAFASKPLIIKNSALGYTMHFYMDEFVYYKTSGYAYYDGSFKFVEDTSNIGEFELQNRAFSYKGSRMHFFRSLWENKLKENFYDITDEHHNSLRYADIVIEDGNGNKYISYDGEMYIYFYRYETKITLRKNLVYFEENGSYDPVGIRWDGFLANKRVADWLPLEYEPIDE